MQKSVKSKKVERGEGGEAGVAGDAQGWRCSAVQGRRCCSSQPKMHFPLARKWHSRKNLKGNGAGAKWKFETLGALSRKSLAGLASSSELMLGFSLSRDCGRGVSQCVRCPSRLQQLQQKCSCSSVCRIDGTLVPFSPLPSLSAPSPILVCSNLHIATVSDMFELSLCAQTLSSIDMLDVNCLTHSIFGLRDWSQWKSSLN